MVSFPSEGHKGGEGGCRAHSKLYTYSNIPLNMCAKKKTRTFSTWNCHAGFWKTIGNRRHRQKSQVNRGFFLSPPPTPPLTLSLTSPPPGLRRNAISEAQTETPGILKNKEGGTANCLVDRTRTGHWTQNPPFLAPVCFGWLHDSAPDAKFSITQEYPAQHPKTRAVGVALLALFLHECWLPYRQGYPLQFLDWYGTHCGSDVVVWGGYD